MIAKMLKHNGEELRRLYAAVPGPVRVGIASTLRLDGSQANKLSNRNENNRDKNTERQLYLINIHSSASKSGATLPS
jgi:hypothetical protein